MAEQVNQGPRSQLTSLLQLSSSAFPLGSFHYSQGLETAVELGFVTDYASFHHWLTVQMRESMANLDLPVLCRMMQAYEADDLDQLETWVEFLVASRETYELRQEEQARGQAMIRILDNFEIGLNQRVRRLVTLSQLAGHAVLAKAWRLDFPALANAMLYSFLENQVTAGIKTIPLGQSAGQKLLWSVGQQLEDWVEHAGCLADDEIGASTHGLAILSSLHETQYTRLFRS